MIAQCDNIMVKALSWCKPMQLNLYADSVLPTQVCLFHIILTYLSNHLIYKKAFNALNIKALLADATHYDSQIITNIMHWSRKFWEIDACALRSDFREFR